MISAVGLVISSPITLLSALLIALESGRPVLFKQARIGYKGKVFQMVKFRSMIQNAEHTGSGVYSDKGDARVTRIGKILRASSIDELPQLVNILKGDMSLIGPRPPLTYHPWPIEQYTEEQLHMFDVRPGITGWAQVNGYRGETKEMWQMEERVVCDIWYLENWSFSLDVRIIVKTILNMVHGEKAAY